MYSKINYIWVGKPRSVTVDKPQQDLVGPLKMHSAIDKNKTVIRFWCLEKYTAHYGALLKGKPILVSSIESFLVEKLDQRDMNAAAKNIGTLINRVIQEDFQIRACVTVKESFAFFLMAAEGGYVLDTNVLPASDYIEFPEHDVFFMPAYHLPVLNWENDDDTDVGIMFSPRMNRVHANRALNFFLKRLNEIDQSILFREGYSENYKAALIHVVIQAALVCNSDQSHSDVAFWRARRLGVGFPVVLDEQPRVVKYYANSHGADRGHRSTLHDAAALGDLVKVKELLEIGCLYETISTTHYGKITPFFAAQFYGNKAVADQLIREEEKFNSNIAPVSVEGFSIGLNIPPQVAKLTPAINLNENNADIRFFTPKNKPSNPRQEKHFLQCVVM